MYRIGPGWRQAETRWKLKRKRRSQLSFLLNRCSSRLRPQPRLWTSGLLSNTYSSSPVVDHRCRPAARASLKSRCALSLLAALPLASLIPSRVQNVLQLLLGYYSCCLVYLTIPACRRCVPSPLCASQVAPSTLLRTTAAPLQRLARLLREQTEAAEIEEAT